MAEQTSAGKYLFTSTFGSLSQGLITWGALSAGWGWFGVIACLVLTIIICGLLVAWAQEVQRNSYWRTLAVKRTR